MKRRCHGAWSGIDCDLPADHEGRHEGHAACGCRYAWSEFGEFGVRMWRCPDTFSALVSGVVDRVARETDVLLGG